jgi:hypothetical protein
MKAMLGRCIVLMLVALGSANAQNNSTSSYYEIRNVIFWSKIEPIYPTWAGYISVEFTQPLVWATTGTCNTSTVAVRPEDTHIISAVQVALATGKPVRLYSDDAQRVDGSYCILRALQY